MSADERATVNMALGRIFRLMNRSTQPGDVAEYERCRGIILDAIDQQIQDHRPNYARDRFKGAAGD